MKILVFLGNDAANLSIESIVKELIQRHEVRIVAPNREEQQIQMFKSLGDVVLLENYSQADEEWADCAFCTVMSAAQLQRFRKYVFSFCHMNPRFDQPRGYDFVFTLGEVGEQDAPLYFASLPVGLAKNDIPVTAIPKKQILYVDAGHFPFGPNGQKQIAEMLLNICKEFPEYNICVKPRWFPGATDREMSNQNFGHIYEEIEKLCQDGLPTNLELLHEYRNLQELIDESECTISSCTSAYLDVAMRGKPLLLIKGLDNEDMYHLRSAYFDNLYEFAEESGCVVDYREVTKYLPQGKQCNPEHIKRSFSYPNGAVNRVVEVMEHVYDSYISKGCYPDIKQYTYENYKTELSCETQLKTEDLLVYRCFCATETAFLLTYKISEKLDWSKFYEQQLVLCRGAVLAKGIAQGKLRNMVLKLKCQYVLDHKEFAKNEVDDSYLYYAMYELERKKELLDCYTKKHKEHESLKLYVAHIYWDLEEKQKAIDLYKEYLCNSIGRTYPKYISDTFVNRELAFERVLNALSNGENLDDLYLYTKYYLTYIQRYPRERYSISNMHLHKICRKLSQAGYSFDEEQFNRVLKELGWLKCVCRDTGIFFARVARVLQKKIGKIQKKLDSVLTKFKG